MPRQQTAPNPLPRLQPPPACLPLLFEALDAKRARRSLQAALARDFDVSAEFLKLAQPRLPARRLHAVNEAIALLDDGAAMRLAVLAAGCCWLRTLVGARPEHRPLLRHVIAAAMAAEPLGRESGVLDPLHAYALGLLHHVGDAALLGSGRGEFTRAAAAGATAVLLETVGAPKELVQAMRQLGDHDAEPRGDEEDGLGLEARILAAADHAVTAFGYAAPACIEAVGGDPIVRTAADLFDQQARLCAAIEDALVAATRDDARHGSHGGGDAAFSPLVLGDAAGVSTRDLGPLPVLFARISGGRDPEAVEVATTAGLVEELGAPRAFFLRFDADALALNGGIVCSRGNVPLPLQPFVAAVESLPQTLRLVLTERRPILHEGNLAELTFLGPGTTGAVFLVAVSVDNRHLGILGADVSPDASISPDVLASVAAHCALARRAADLRKLSDEATTDELTGLFNRRGISDILERCLAAADQRNENLAIALIDCDHLKKVNDNFGHLMGDEFVRRSSEVVRASLRVGDEIGRYGGDEFLAVLPNASLAHTRAAMERARSAVEQAGLESTDGLLLSVSIGAVVRGRTRATREQLLKLADTALYKAKQRGRNSLHVVNAECPPDVAL